MLRKFSDLCSIPDFKTEDSMGKNVIQIKNVFKNYGDFTAVNDISFDVEESSCYGFLGPNGAGKTTLMNIIYGRARRDLKKKSVVDIFGYDPQHNELEIKYLAGVVPQENNLDEELNVMENLVIYSKFYNIPAAKSAKTLEPLLDFMELGDKKKVRIRELSGGMKRRLIIARALIHKPRLLILDEPTTGLDPQVRHTIWEKLRQLKNDGTTILLTTHYMEEAFQICDKILIMDKGKKILEGEPRDLLNTRIESYVLEMTDKNCRQGTDSISGLIDEKNVRKDEAGGITFLYSNSFEHLKKISECLMPGGFYLRQTTLEDLFLRITGRHLNEKQ